MEKLKIYVTETTRDKHYTKEIDDTLEAMQEVVDGPIQTVDIAQLREKNITLICNEEGLLRHLPPNANLYPFFFVGTVFFIGVDDDLISLTDEQIAFIQAWIDTLQSE